MSMMPSQCCTVVVMMCVVTVAVMLLWGLTQHTAAGVHKIDNTLKGPTQAAHEASIKKSCDYDKLCAAYMGLPCSIGFC
jgi:hypothetical protein